MLHPSSVEGSKYIIKSTYASMIVSYLVSSLSVSHYHHRVFVLQNSRVSGNLVLSIIPYQ